MPQLLNVWDARNSGRIINVPTPVEGGDIVNKDYVDKTRFYTITQINHGYTDPDVGTPLRLNGSAWVPARADNPINAEALGLLGAVLGPNSFTVVYSGPIDNLPYSLVPGEIYFLDAAAYGNLVLTSPTAPGSVSKPMLYATDVHAGVVLPYRGFVNPEEGTAVPGGGTVVVRFDYVSPQLIYHVPAGQTLAHISVDVTELWDGGGASLKLGTLTDPEAFFGAGDTELTVEASFSKDFNALGPVDIHVMIEAGLLATAGEATIQLSTIPTGT